MALDPRPLTPIGGALPAIPEGGDLLFVVGGDNRPTGRNAPMPRVTKQIFSEVGLIRPDFVLWSGDVVYGYGDTPAELSREYDRFAEAAALAHAPLFDAPGNHEIHHRKEEPCEDHASELAFAKRFGNLYGSFDLGGAHFIALDAEGVCSEDRLDPTQRAWLEADLVAHKNARAIFVFTHSVFFAPPLIDPDSAKPEIGDKADLIALFRRYSVRAVFSGHAHLYSHESHDGIDYFIAGGAGAPLYAPPERGGFSHYVIVRLAGNALSYDVVEPGHLYVEAGPDLHGKATTWIVNGNDADIPLRGAPIAAPSSLGPCRSLLARSDLKKTDGTPVPVPVSVRGCSSGARGRQAILALASPRGTSVPVSLRRSP
jgi:3',5'-cyclic AMP phosphodiesterase CpdA